jgi:hypothetical protein
VKRFVGHIKPLFREPLPDLLPSFTGSEGEFNFREERANECGFGGWGFACQFL